MIFFVIKYNNNDGWLLSQNAFYYNAESKDDGSVKIKSKNDNKELEFVFDVSSKDLVRLGDKGNINYQRINGRQ